MMIYWWYNASLSCTNNILRETWEPDDDEAVGGRGQVETKGVFLPFLFCDPGAARSDDISLGDWDQASRAELSKHR